MKAFSRREMLISSKEKAINISNKMPQKPPINTVIEPDKLSVAQPQTQPTGLIDAPRVRLKKDGTPAKSCAPKTSQVANLITGAQRKQVAPTPKQEIFARAWVRTNGNGLEAAQEAYNTDKPNVLRSIAHENLTKPIVSNRISQLLNESGLCLSNLSKDLCVIKNTASRALVINDSIVEHPDYGTRLDAVKTAYKLHGVLDKEQSQVIGAQVSISLGDADRVGEMIGKLEALTSKMGLLVEDGEVVHV